MSTVAISLEDLERKLTRPASAQEMRALYAAAFREVTVLVREGGETLCGDESRAADECGT